MLHKPIDELRRPSLIVRDRIAMAAFVLSAILLAYGLGFATSDREWPPSKTLAHIIADTENLALNWRNDFGIEPTRLLVRSGSPDRRPITVVDRDAMMPGQRLVSGLSPGKLTTTGIRLLDQSGREIHFWPVRFEALTIGDINPHAVFLHGTVPLPDGSVVVNFDQGDTIGRIGPCGETVWATAGNFHHGIHRSYDGTIWGWENVPTEDEEAPNEEFLVQLDPETGKRLRQISLMRDIIAKNDEFGRFALHAEENESEIDLCCDPFHPNDIDVLDPETARAFPMFERDDLMISFRSLNMVAVIDPETARVKWASIGPWHRQHDPDFLPDGTISVLDNRMGLGTSQVVAIAPATGEVRTTYRAERPRDFYTWRRGRHQVLPNGNVLIAESERGRVIEVDRAGRTVWSYENIFDRERNGLVNEALILPEGFFAEGAFSECRAPAPGG